MARDIISLAVAISRSFRTFALAATLVGSIFAIGCSEPTRPVPRVQLDADRPNVILIVLDTLRADHLSAYGYERATSPNLDAFAAEATRYSRCIASGSWTLPSHASIFTGKPAFQHGAHRVRKPNGTVVDLALHEDETTLAEVFRGQSYATGAIVANTGIVTADYGFDQGFDTFEGGHVPGIELISMVLDWVSEHADEPFFLFVNFMDTHRYYNTAKRPGDLGLEVGDDDPVSSLIKTIFEQKEPSPDLIAKLTNHYDTAIGNVDHALGQLFATLREWSLFNNSVIVVTSDHGELLGEHTLAEHGRDVYQEALHVPLIVKSPGQHSGRVGNRMVSLCDIPSFIFDCLPNDRFASPAKTFPDQPGNHPIVAQNNYSFPISLGNPAWVDRFKRIRTATFEWPYKVIFSDASDEVEVYNLELDPRELNNLADSQSTLSVRLRMRLNEYTEQRGQPPESRWIPVTPNQKAREALEALGYL